MEITPEHKAKTERLTIKLDKEFLEKVKQEAEKLSLSTSAYVRYVLSKEININD